MVAFEFINTDEAAEVLRVGRHQVNYLIRKGRLPAWRSGRRWWIRPEDLEEFLPLRRFGPDSPVTRP